MYDRERLRPQWWLVAAVFACALLGLTPLAQALEYLRVARFGAVSAVAQTIMAALWLVAARRLVARVVGRRREGVALWSLAAITTLVCLVASVLLLWIIRPPSPYGPMTSVLLLWLGWLPTQLMTAGVLALVSSWTDASLQRQRAEDQQALLTASVVKAELDSLRARLEPHFLLNALNTVAALARMGNGDRAADAAADLGELLRFALAEQTDAIPFDAERHIVERYLAIEAARLGERLRVVWHIDPAARSALMPPLIWQPLVENAVRHGIARRADGGELRLEAKCKGAQLTLVVESDGTPSSPYIDDRDPGGLGIGLSATRRRLALLFGDRASLSLTTHAERTRATLVLPQAVSAAECP